MRILQVDVLGVMHNNDILLKNNKKTFSIKMIEYLTAFDEKKFLTMEPVSQEIRSPSFLIHAGGMNLLADSFPGNEYSSCLDPPQITWISIFYPFVAKSILQHTTKKPAIPLNIKYTDVQRQSGGCDCGLFTIAYVSIINSQGI